MRRPSIGPRARRSTCSITTCASGSRPRAARPRPRSASSCRPSTTCSRPAARWSVITSSAACCARHGSTSRSGDEERGAGPSAWLRQASPHEWGGVGAGAHRETGMKEPGAAPPPGFARHLPMNGEELKSWELDRNPDLIDLVSAARDAGHEVMLIERPMPDAVSVAAIGRAFDIVAAPGGVALEGADGKTIDFEAGDNRILAASRLWHSLSASLDTIAVGGFAYRPDRDPGGAWSGFPALLFRVPALAVLRRRGRTYLSAATPDAESLLELTAA